MQADQAMYWAKAKGKNTHVWFDVDATLTKTQSPFQRAPQ
jgi:hypothetical protein